MQEKNQAQIQFEDPWLPDVRNPWIESSPTPAIEEAKVVSLKTTSGAAWEEDILRDLFNDRDQMLIQQITLSIRPSQDQWQWRYRGEGSIRSKVVTG